MITIQGLYNIAVCYTPQLEEAAERQIRAVCGRPEFAGCGMETVELAERRIDFDKLDALIRREIPYGREVREVPHPLNGEIDLTQLRCAGQVNLERAMHSIGSLGGGNHFIEVDRSDDGRLFLVVHCGHHRTNPPRLQLQSGKLILPRIAIKMTHCPVVRLNHASSLCVVTGVWLATPAVELLGTAMAAALLLRYRKRYGY